jgi:NADH-quinone oxidoreductase subunit I
MPERYRGLVDLIPEKCIACSQCVKICPTAALQLGSVMNPETKKREPCTFVYNSELCCYCGLCGEVCPTSAMFLNKCYEAAYYKHTDMTAIDLLAKDKYGHLSSPKSRETKKK